MAIQAIKIVREDIPNIQLFLHGSGEYRDSLELLVNEWGLNANVIFSKKFVPTEELANCINEADVGIVPYKNSIFTGGILPTKLMEYAALGIPVIASRTNSIEAYFDDTMVEFFSPDDLDDLLRSIETVYNNYDRLSLLSTNIKKFNDKYNWNLQSEKYIKLIHNLIGVEN